MIRVSVCSLFAALTLLLSWGAAAQNSAAPPMPETRPPAEQPVPSAERTPVQSTAPDAATTTVPEPPAPKPVAEQPAPKAARKGPVDGLKPGQFVWEQRAGYANPLRMVAVLDIQRLYVFDGDELVGFSTISSGKRGKETPSGIFKILQKKVYHESNIYANAPMPFMQRLTWDGIAIHAGHLPGYPASHGCIRLPRRFAEALYGATQLDAEVVILESLSKPLARPKAVEPPAPPSPSKAADTQVAPVPQSPEPQLPQPPASAPTPPQPGTVAKRR